MNRTHLLLAITLLVPLATAEITVTKKTNDFALSSSQVSGKTCGCTDYTLPVDIKNVGDIDAVFSTSVQSQAEWFHVNPDELHLPTGQTGTVDVSGNIPCGAEREVQLTTTVESTHGRQKHIHRDINVVQCTNLDIIEHNTHDTIDPGQLGEFSFTVDNPASFRDNYTVTADRYEDQISFSKTRFELGDQLKIYGHAKFADDQTGTYTIPVTVRSEKNEMRDSTELTLTINNEYPYSAEFPRHANSCQSDEATRTLTLTNKANVDNTYELSGIADQTITVEPGASRNTAIQLPDQPGTNTYTVTIEPEHGNAKEKDIRVNNENCYGHTVRFDNAQIICGDHDLPVTITNQGTREQTLDVALDGPAWTTLETDRVTLRPNQRRTVAVTATPPCADAEANVTVTTRGETIASATAAVNVHTPRSTTQASLAATNYKVRDTVDLRLSNDGIREATYTVETDSPYLTPAKASATIAPDEEGTVTFNLQNVTEGEYLHDITITSDNGVEYHATFGTNVQGPTPGERVADTLNSIGAFIWSIGSAWTTLGLLAVLAALLLILGLIKTGYIPTERFTVQYRTQFYVLYAVLALLFLFGIVYGVTAFTTQPDALYEEQRGAELAFKEGGSLTMNLNEYFTDPDDDTLLYDYEGNDFISVSIEEEKATLSSDKEGRDTVTFIATDEAGATERSDPFTVQVRDYLGSFLQQWKANLTPVNAFVMALIFLVLIFLADTVAPRGKDYYFG